MQYIDLSVDVNEKTPIYPGDPTTKITPSAILDTDGYEDHFVSIGTHVGTHVDAPRHMIKNGKSLHEYTVDKFIGRGVFINTGRTYDLDLVKNSPIQEGDIVLFHTGMSDVYHIQEYYDNYPAMTEEIAEYLISKKVKMVGVDTCSVDHEQFVVHKMLLGNDILIIENLTNLKSIEGKDFRIYALPLKLHIDGSPARVIAEIK